MGSLPLISFYFTRHSRAVEELDTSLLKELIHKVHVIYHELPGNYLPTELLEGLPEELVQRVRRENHREFERGWNEYIASGKMSGLTGELFDLYADDSSTKALMFLANLMRGTGKRLFFERTTPPLFDYYKESAAPTDSFVLGKYDEAFKKVEAFLEKASEYETQREEEAADQLFSLLEPTLVIFGAGHRDLARRVSEKRPVEIHYPYKDYIWSFTDEMFEHYKKDKKFDREFFLRSEMEGMAKGVIETMYGETITSRELGLMIHYYSSSLTPEQIVTCNDYMISCLRLLVGISPGDIFESFIGKEHLPAPSQLLEKIRSESVR